MKETGILEGNYDLSPRGDIPKSVMIDSTYKIPAWNAMSTVKQLDLARIKGLLKQPVIFDGRNIYDPEEMRLMGFSYRGIGRGFNGK